MKKNNTSSSFKKGKTLKPENEIRFSDNLEELEQIDKVKSRVLKYIVYMK